MARPNKPVAWSPPHGVFLVNDRPAPPPARSLFARQVEPGRAKRTPPKPLSPAEKLVIVAAICCWLWSIGFKALALFLELVR